MKKKNLCAMSLVLAGLLLLGACGKNQENETTNTSVEENSQKDSDTEAIIIEETENTESLEVENTETGDAFQEESQAESQADSTNYEEITSDQTPKVYDAIAVVGDTGYELYTYKDQMAQDYAGVVNTLADDLAGTANVYDVIIPLSSYITLPDNLRDSIPSDNQHVASDKIASYLDDNVIAVNLFDTMMSHRSEYIYYRTDHHWTALGAYYGYTAFCQAKGITAENLEDYQEMCFQNYLGSFYKDLDDNAALATNPDDVYAYMPNSNATMTVYPAEGDAFTWPVVKDVSDYNSGQKYNAFIGGDNPYSVIENTDIADGSSCIVVKESFGNAFVPFLVDHYQTIYVVDYRYWDGSIEELAKNQGVDDVILVNNLSMIRNQYLVGQLQSRL